MPARIHISRIVEQPRYEYRVWSDHFAELRDHLRALAVAAPPALSGEIYLITSRTDDCNLKIRAGRLNLKKLIGNENGLELWKPALDRDFPVETSIITDQVFPCLELQSPELQRPLYSRQDFLNEVIRAEPKIAIIPIAKKRERFQLDECLAEFTSVTVDQREWYTVGLESVKPDAVLRFVSQLRIAGLPNISYIRQLKRILTGLSRDHN